MKNNAAADRAPDLAKAQKIIVTQIMELKAEKIPLGHAAGRVAAETVKAPRPVPAFSRSTRDGFAVASADLPAAGDVAAPLTISGEVAAGCTEMPTLKRLQAISIMTGGAIPPGANQVVPFEQCRPKLNTVAISTPADPGAFILPKGADARKGQAIIHAGQVIHPAHLPLLAAMGIPELTVHRKPRVAFFCSGSELLELSATPSCGQIIGGNRYLLAALINDCGGLPLDMGIVADDTGKIQGALAKSLAGSADIIITTGGMGPGRYDLIAEALTGSGVTIFYRRLSVRPGQATLFGTLHGKPIFALPGPPPAVFPLFHELVRPAIRKMQGHITLTFRPCRAVLQEDLVLKNRGCQNLKTAVLRAQREILTVRPAKRYEAADAIIVIPANRRRLLAGEKVTVHALAS